MTVHTVTQNTDVILALEFQKHFSNDPRKHGIIYHRKNTKSSSKQNLTIREYRVHHKKDVDNQDVIFFAPQTKFLNSSFLGHTTNQMVYVG